MCTICASHFIHPQAEMVEKEQKLETLQGKVSELKKCSQSQETPAKLQVQKMIIICVLCFSVMILYFTMHSTLVRCWRMTFVKRSAQYRSSRSRPGETSWTSLSRGNSWKTTSHKCLHGSKVWRIPLFLLLRDRIPRTSAE